MATTISTPAQSNSTFPYPDGVHSWHNFRVKALAPRRIQMHTPSTATGIPSSLLLEIETKLDGLKRFDEQRSEFRCQVENNKAFTDSPVFPPNVLPSLEEQSDVNRVTSPRWISRESLPTRGAATESGPLLELPSPRHGAAVGFRGEAFTELEREAIPTSLGISGTVVHFADGLVSPGIPLYAPFIVFERSKGSSTDRIELAKNQCAIGGSACVRAYKLLYNRAYGVQDSPEKHMAFSCIIDNSFAILNYHWLEHDDEHHMSPLCKFDLTNDEHFNKFQAWIQAIEDWGATTLLPKIKAALNSLVSYDPTPPLSPIPSLSLSIDTNPGGDDSFMKALRSTYDDIQWRYASSRATTPIRSALANCGTPQIVRQVRVMTMSPLTPDSPGVHRGLPLYTYDQNPKSSLTPYTPPRKTYDMSPLRLATVPESPVRPGETLSPCSPPLEAPLSTRNPMLVLRRRLDHAHDEIRDLKRQLDQANAQRRVTKAEMTEDMRQVALDMFESLLKQAHTDKLQKSPIPSPTSTITPSSVKEKTSQVDAMSPKQLAFAMMIASLLVIGTLFGHRIPEVSCFVPSFLSPSRFLHQFRMTRSASSAALGTWLSLR